MRGPENIFWRAIGLHYPPPPDYFALTFLPLLLSSLQKFALQHLLGGKVWYGDFEPHFLKEEWGFLLSMYSFPSLIGGIIWIIIFIPANTNR